MDVDVIVVGSGGTGMSAALAAAVGGAQVLVLERTDRIGGTTTYSGGALWIPNNRLMAEAGMPDSRDEALTYLRTLTMGFVPESMLTTFVDTVNPMIEFFETYAGFEMSCRYAQADYQPNFSGAKAGGRCIESDRILYTRDLGEYGPAFRNSATPRSPHRFTPTCTRAPNSRKMQRTGVDIDPAVARERAEQGALMRGRGLIACLLHTGMKHGLHLQLNSAATRLIKDRDRVVGVEVDHDGSPEVHRARLGVVLATGGFEWNAQMVRGFLGVPELTPASPPTGLGLGLGLALEAGAAIGNMTNAWWDVVMHEPGQIYDGKPYYQTTALWRGRAGTMMVNRHGRRFVNESMNYSDMGVIMKAFDPLAYELSQHAELRHLRRRPTGKLPHRQPRPRQRRPRLADPCRFSIAELAERAHIDGAGLASQLEVFNRHAARGVDPEFQRGDDPYDRYRGDPSSPHPNLRPLEPPYYVMPQTLGCLGTKGGPVTNEDAQVVDLHGRPIRGPLCLRQRDVQRVRLLLSGTGRHARLRAHLRLPSRPPSHPGGPRPMSEPGRSQAVVIGGSIAGLLAARVLADFYDSVVVVDRDDFPDEPVARKGAMQGVHFHALLAKGRIVAEALFPGFGTDLVAQGASTYDASEAKIYEPYGWGPTRAPGVTLVGASRLLIEHVIRRRVTVMPNVEIRPATEAVGLSLTEDGSRVRAVHTKDRNGSGREIAVTGDVVIDASGRAAAAAHWLPALDYFEPPTTTVNAHWGYASRFYAIPAGYIGPVVGGFPLRRAGNGPPSTRGGFLLKQENGTWLITLSGCAKGLPHPAMRPDSSRSRGQSPSHRSGRSSRTRNHSPPSALGAIR